MGKVIGVVSLIIVVFCIIVIASTASHNLSKRDNNNEGGVVASSSSNSDGPVTFDDKLTRLDAALSNLVDSCSKDIYDYVKVSCINEIEDAWWMECSEYYDKLETCKSGKVENFLKNHGVPT